MTFDEQKTAMLMLATCAKYMENINGIFDILNPLLIKANVNVEMPINKEIPELIHDFLREVNG